MKKLGQHFLKNSGVVKTIARSIDPKAGDIIIEIGPGHGELSAQLANRTDAFSVIEKDERLAEELRQRATREGWGIEVVSGDALEMLPAMIRKYTDARHGITFNDGNFPPKQSVATKYQPHAERRLLHATTTAPRASGHTLKIVGNIPYYITGHLLRIISELDCAPDLCVFLIQEEVAERIAAQPPRMNRLAASIQFWARPEIILHVPREDFAPPPNVDSAVIRLSRKTDVAPVGATEHEEETGGSRSPRRQPRASGQSHASDSRLYYATVRALFAQPRKTISNNIRAAIMISGKSDRRTPKETSAAALRDAIIDRFASIGIDSSLRPQNLTVEDIHAIAREFKDVLA